MAWEQKDIGDQSGKIYVITGANSGIGLWATIALVNRGARILMACRDPQRSAEAFDKVMESADAHPGAGSAELIQLDLANLDSVADAASSINASYSHLDGLVNNAGVMGGARQSTAQGFELQVGTNYLGHFELTARLWPILRAADQARVVCLSSLAARSGVLNPAMDADVLTDPEPYASYEVYSNSKQAMLLFSHELSRRVAEEGLPIESIAAHPGVSSTNLFNRQLREKRLDLLVPFATALGRAAFHSPKAAARPTLRALTDPAVLNGSFVGPGAVGQFRGAPTVVRMYSSGKDPATAARLWELSEEITGTTFTVA